MVSGGCAACGSNVVITLRVMVLFDVSRHT
jgi:hypothetical protein